MVLRREISCILFSLLSLARSLLPIGAAAALRLRLRLMSIYEYEYDYENENER